jgi:hypothetical protein
VPIAQLDRADPRYYLDQLADRFRLVIVSRF